MSNGYDASYGSYSAPTGYSGYGNNNNLGASSGGLNNGGGQANAMLRRRNIEHNTQQETHSSGATSDSKYRQRNVVKNLDFMFPKVDTEFTVQTDRGGIAFVVACVVIVILCIAETLAWRGQNLKTIEHVVVDTSLGQKMQVNLNITFPALACVDLHVDIMDVAGDSQLDLDQSSITKTRLFANGTVAGAQQRDVGNKHRKQQDDIVQHIQKKALPEDYCGPCFGAQERDDQCCNTCDQLIDSYKKKNWSYEDILQTSEQCIREGRNLKTNANDKSSARHASLTLGEGCNLVGHMKLNRVAGNFHIAMGEGIQRNGKHVHIFNPDETHHFNASHIIHHLSFGGHHDEPFGGAASAEETPLNGVTKIVEAKHGTTGLFQYFIKIVPTTYVTNERRRETNGFFFTERFRPLMKEYFTEELTFVEPEMKVKLEEGSDAGDEKDKDGKDSAIGSRVAAEAGQSGKHAHHAHHNVKSNSILPGVFFIYEIYPFAVEVRPNVVPITHLMIRLMATVGGVFAIVQFLDGLLDKRKTNQQQQRHSPGRRPR
ncbi:hypothetical protein ACA910_017724 [Epithemia clementina (nom. ined.)]